jgi:hypothetical protein
LDLPDPRSDIQEVSLSENLGDRLGHAFVWFLLYENIQWIASSRGEQHCPDGRIKLSMIFCCPFGNVHKALDAGG